MLTSIYPVRLIAATLLTMLVLTSCGGKKGTLHFDQQREAEIQAAAQARALAQKNSEQQIVIDGLVAQARLEKPETYALDRLLLLSQDPTIPSQSQGQAALQYAELLFEFERPNALQVCKETIEQWPNHPYLPYIYLTLAEQWLWLDNTEEAISALTKGAQQPWLAPDALERNIDLAEPLLEEVSSQASLEWMLAISKHDSENREFWLKQAAKLASLDYILQLRQSEHPIGSEQINFYRYVARERLMVGDYHAVRVIFKILEMDMPDSDAREIVQQWAESEGKRNIVGVLLPLTGKYSSYGKQALQGIRLAMSRPEFESNIVLRIQDTAGKSEQTISAYYQLLTQGSEWVIGPLLSSNTKALVPYITETIPVISLSNQVQLAEQSYALFIHSLAKTIQASFMATQAIKQGKTKALVLHGYKHSETEEAISFSQTFMNLGGEIVDVIELEKRVNDNRPDLVSTRYLTDDEELLASLDEELHLFSVETNMDIKMPIAFDAIYIAATGKKVSVLVGQMAYADIRGIQLYGSYRWADGHLLDDHGRYLSGSQFSTPPVSLNQPNQAVLDVKSQYRIIWGKNNSSPLFALAYDTAMGVASLGSRLGIKGEEAIDALASGTSFPAISGNYFFNEDGISQKKFAVQTIRRGRLETLQVK